jgi:molybdopterin adenylyltransferase
VTPLTAAIVTISTKGAAGKRADESGPAIREALEAAGIKVVHTKLVSDGVTPVGNAIREASQKANVVITSGGTGLSPNDMTPEATRRVIDREAPGIAEALRAHSLTKTPHGMLSRGVAGTLGAALVVNLPGSPKAARESLEILIPVLAHAVELLAGESGEGGHRNPA